MKSLDEYFPNSKNKDLGAKYIVLEGNIHKPQTRDYLNLECKVCGYRFSQRANSVFLGVISCKCSKSYRLSEKDVENTLTETCFDKGLLVTNVQLLSPIGESIVRFVCIACDKESSKTYSNIVYNSIGCTHCTKKYRPTFKESILKIEEKLQGKFRPISYPTDKISGGSKILVECLDCNRKSSKSVRSILYSDCGCPCNANWGFNHSVENFMYLIKMGISKVFYKVGVTNSLQRRFREISRSNKKDIEIVCTWTYPPNSSILEHEKLLKIYFSDPLTLDPNNEIISGRTELVSQESLPVLAAIQSLQSRQRYGFTS